MTSGGLGSIEIRVALSKCDIHFLLGIGLLYLPNLHISLLLLEIWMRKLPTLNEKLCNLLSTGLPWRRHGRKNRNSFYNARYFRRNTILSYEYEKVVAIITALSRTFLCTFICILCI